MDKRKQSGSGMSNRNSDKNNNDMSSKNKTPNRGNNPDDMRQAKIDEQKELREEASLPEDPDPVLDEQDLEENHLSVDEADDIEWDPQSGKNKRSGL